MRQNCAAKSCSRCWPDLLLVLIQVAKPHHQSCMAACMHSRSAGLSGVKVQQASCVKPDAANCHSLPAVLFEGRKPAGIHLHAAEGLPPSCRTRGSFCKQFALSAAHLRQQHLLATDLVRSTAADPPTCQPLHPLCAPHWTQTSVAGFLLSLIEPGPAAKAAALMPSLIIVPSQLSVAR